MLFSKNSYCTKFHKSFVCFCKYVLFSSWIKCSLDAQTYFRYSRPDLNLIIFQSISMLIFIKWIEGSCSSFSLSLFLILTLLYKPFNYFYDFIILIMSRQIHTWAFDLTINHIYHQLQNTLGTIMINYI